MVPAMRRGFVAFVALTLVGLGLTGCGLFRYEQREPWRAQAEEACLASGQVRPTAYMAEVSMSTPSTPWPRYAFTLVDSSR